MQSKNISKAAADIRKLFHALPAACRLAGREYIRMVIIIAIFAPTIGVNIELIKPHFLKLFHLLRTFAECRVQYLVRAVFVIEF